MVSSNRRRSAIAGLIFGAAIGDALGIAREGLSRRAALRIWGKPPIKYQLLPGVGLFSDDTQLMLLTAQAILRSRSNQVGFRVNLARRLSWYLLSLPAGIGRATFLSMCKLWCFFPAEKAGIYSAGCGPATRALMIGIATIDTGIPLKKWIETSTSITHRHPHALAGAMLLGRAAQFAVRATPGQMDVLETWDAIVAEVEEEKLKGMLDKLRPLLVQGRSSRAAARALKLEKGPTGYMYHVAVMALYCWMRHPTNFTRVVESAVLLGGDSDSVAAVAGGLSGLHIGRRRIPPAYIEGLGDWPCNREWLEQLVGRLGEWPHGVNDLLSAPAVPLTKVGQLARNIYFLILVLLHIIYRMPCWMLTSSRGRAYRRNRRRNRK